MLPLLRQKGKGRVNTDEAPSEDSSVEKDLVYLNVHEVPLDRYAGAARMRLLPWGLAFASLLYMIVLSRVEVIGPQGRC